MDAFGLAALGAAGVVAQKLFGKTLDEMGSDINSLYRRGRDRVLLKAASKVADPEDGRAPNLRVARDVLWNGAVTESEICAEYFGGVLASSRSADGTDDASIHYLDVIKSLSSKQLHLHYCIYRALQKLLVSQGSALNVGMGTELAKVRLYGSPIQAELIGLNLGLDIAVLARNGLIGEGYEVTGLQTKTGETVPYFYVRPTSFGIALYAVAFNRLDDWRSYSTEDFGAFEGIEELPVAARTIEAFYKRAGFELPDDILKKYKEQEAFERNAIR